MDKKARNENRKTATPVRPKKASRWDLSKKDKRFLRSLNVSPN
jgi:hypothetical protein